MRSDEMGIILSAMCEMNGRLAGTISNIRDISGEVAEGCSELSLASDNLSKGANQQAAGIEQIAANVLYENQRMRALARDLGFRLAPSQDDPHTLLLIRPAGEPG